MCTLFEVYIFFFFEKKNTVFSLFKKQYVWLKNKREPPPPPKKEKNAGRGAGGRATHIMTEKVLNISLSPHSSCLHFKLRQNTNLFQFTLD